MSGGLASIIFGIIMQKSFYFKKSTSILLILCGTGALFVLIPKIGLLLLFFLSTIVGVIATILVGTDLLKTFKLLDEEI